MQIKFRIVKWSKTFQLDVDGETHFECKHGELRELFYEMEKISRLRFKGELQHSPKHRKVKP